MKALSMGDEVQFQSYIVSDKKIYSGVITSISSDPLNPRRPKYEIICTDEDLVNLVSDGMVQRYHPYDPTSPEIDEITSQSLKKQQREELNAAFQLSEPKEDIPNVLTKDPMAE